MRPPSPPPLVGRWLAVSQSVRPSVVCQIFALLLGGFCNRKSGGVALALAPQPPTWFMSVHSVVESPAHFMAALRPFHSVEKTSTSNETGGSS